VRKVKVSLKEKHERYKAEQERLGAAKKRKAEDDATAWQMVVEERCRSLISALKGLRAEELLTEVRDEIWELGEVEVGTPWSPGPDWSLISVSVSLSAHWPVFVPAGSEPYFDGRQSWPNHIGEHREVFSIGVSLHDSVLSDPSTICVEFGGSDSAGAGILTPDPKYARLSDLAREIFPNVVDRRVARRRGCKWW
jgi:hypothetical protein